MTPKRAARKAVSKRAARKAAPPLPPAESSDETQSHSPSDESEDEKAIAKASIPAVKNAPAPPQKGDESESSEEDDDDYEGEEEDQPARAPPKNQPPPLQEKEDSDTSGSDDDEDDEEDGPTRAAPPSAAKKQPTQPEKSEDSDTSGDDNDEEESPPPPKPAPTKEESAMKPSASAAAAKEAKKPGFRIWSKDDEVRILEAIAAHQKQHGGIFPRPDALVAVLAGKLDNTPYGSRELQIKLGTLKRRYVTLSNRGEVPSNEHDRRILDLSKIVWDGDKTTAAATNNGHQQKGFEEMCELYPCLAEEVKELEAAHPGMYKREFGKMDGDKARAMDDKIKKQRVVQIRVEMRRADLAREVTKALMDLVDA